MTFRRIPLTITLVLTWACLSESFFVQQQCQRESNSPFCMSKSGSNNKEQEQNNNNADSQSSKSSDRAHIERNLEDMMGNDWREFRAKLVTQERLLGGIPTANPPPTIVDAEDEKLAKQGQLGELFAGAISSIFESSKKKKQRKQQREEQQQQNNIFDGDTVGTPATDSSMETLSSSSSISSTTAYEDPFVSAAEIPIFLEETKIDKHRWAHAIPHVEPGCVLLANEKLGGVFHQTVVLIVQHCEKSGSIGIVINRPLPGDLLKVASETQDSNLDLSLKLAFSTSPVTYGGPVLPEEFSILHGFGEVQGATKLVPGVYVGGSEELMAEVRMQRLDPRQALFVQGHAAWVPGQLSKEIAKGVWYTAAASTDFLLRYAGAKVTADDNPQDLWADILMCMGGEYATVAQAHPGRGDTRMP